MRVPIAAPTYKAPCTVEKDDEFTFLSANPIPNEQAHTVPQQGFAKFFGIDIIAAMLFHEISGYAPLTQIHIPLYVGL